MSKKIKIKTPATRFLDSKKIPYAVHIYDYMEKGGTRVASESIGVDEHAMIKTLVMEVDRKPLIILMHGDMQVSTKSLARQLDVKEVIPCRPDIAQKHTGYMVGGTSPFGTRKELKVYIEKTITELETVYINGGKRGVILEIKREDLLKSLPMTTVEAAIPH